LVYPVEELVRTKVKIDMVIFFWIFVKVNNVFIMNGRLGKDQIGNLTCRNASVVDYCLSNVHFLERHVDLEILEFSTLFSDVHTPFTLTLKGIQSLRLIFFILKVANIRCFILIAVEMFHNIIRI
jgi:hypothetical protein